MSPNPRFGIRRRWRRDVHVDTSAASLTGTLFGAGSTSSSTSTEPTSLTETHQDLGLQSGKSREREIGYRNGAEERDGTRYVTLTVTRDSGTYVTLVALGDTALPTAYAATRPSPRKLQNPSIPTGTIVGIVVGIFLGVMLLVGVFYVYLLRARHLKRLRRRRRRARRASVSGGPSPAPPPGEGPFPPANP